MKEYIDTHTHLYLTQFDNDREAIVGKAIEEAGIQWFLLPNVDEETIEPMLSLHRQFPQQCLPMMGLHPTSVKPGYKKILEQMKSRFGDLQYYAVGETGIDLYWDKTFFDLQQEAFRIQIEWALEMDLPLVVHARDSLPEIIEVLQPYRNQGLKGIMHCFPGDVEMAQWFAGFGFLLGIGGVVTYKNSLMAKVVEAIALDYLVLETDAPYLTPAPHRGKRNDPSNLPIIASKIAELKHIPLDEVARVTTATARTLFKIS